MSHLYTYRLKSFLRDKSNMFWTLAFPLLLAIFFQLSFGTLMNRVESFAAVPVAVVGQGEGGFAEALDALGEGEDAVLVVSRMGEAEALAALDAGEVAGIITLGGATPTLTLDREGMEQSILKSVMDKYLQISATMQNVAQQNPAALAAAMQAMLDTSGTLATAPESAGNMDNMAQLFYSLVAFACLSGSFFGLLSGISIRPGLSAVGLRRAITPTRKSTLLTTDLLAAFTVVFAEVLVLLLFLRFVLGRSLGAHIPAILLLCLLGSLAGVVLGLFVGVVFRFSKGAKEGILVCLSLLLCFFSGMMYPGMRYIIERSVPIFNRINPASVMVDAFYALDAYGPGPRYWWNMGILALIVAVLATGCVASLRRKQHASI